MFFRRFAAGLVLASAASSAWAGLPTFCERERTISALEQDRVLRFAAVVKQELARSGARVALVSRAGVDLSRFGLLYSHAGIALRDSPGGPWAVRQLYYACDDARPYLFDQGVSGFALGADAPARGHISLLFLPDEEGALLERAALDKRLALALLAGRYSANAYAWGTRYQNCNQWVAELLASAWGGIADDVDVRERAQLWLRTNGYIPGPINVPSHWLMFAGQFVPLVHVDDHPLDDLHALALQVSVPASIDAFVLERVPGTQRVEVCHDEQHIVVRRNGARMDAACTALPGDEVTTVTQDGAR